MKQRELLFSAGLELKKSFGAGLEHTKWSLGSLGADTVELFGAYSY